MRIPYYPGCTLSTIAKGFESSAKDAALSIGFELAEMPAWNCCGAAFPLTPDNLIALSAPAKVLSSARKTGDTLTTLCSVCYNVLKRTNNVMKNDREKRAVINSFIEADYDGSLNVTHFLEILRDRVGLEQVKKAVKTPLKGLKAAAYYGCMLLRPFEDMGIDDAEDPVIMENLLAALGAEAIKFPNRIECCGAHLAMTNEDIVVKLSGNVMTSAVKNNAELIVTTCPLCHYNLEKSQSRVASDTPGYAGIPIVYFTQMLGLALGQDVDSLGFDKNMWDARPLLKKKGIIK